MAHRPPHRDQKVVIQAKPMHIKTAEEYLETLEEEEAKSGTADGIQKVLEFLPFIKTNLNVFLSLLEEIY